MSKPRIAVPLPTSFDLEYNRRCWPQYAHAVRAAGGEAVQIDLSASPAEIAKMAATCGGVLLPGSPADVNPQKYGHPVDPATASADLSRENADELLLQDAHNLYKPIFGICYGAQSLNVWRGGTLVQDLNVLPVNHEAGPAVAIAHDIVVEARSLVNGQELVQDQQSLRLSINSSHHQAIGIAGDGLNVVARCPLDGVVEAVEGSQPSKHFVLGVQWHPERSYAITDNSRCLFTRFVGACAVWSPRPIEVSVA